MSPGHTPPALLWLGVTMVHLLDQLPGQGCDGTSPNRSTGFLQGQGASPALSPPQGSHKARILGNVITSRAGKKPKEGEGWERVRYICSRCYLEEENTFISPVDCQLIFLQQALMENNKTHFSQAVSRTLTGQAGVQNRLLRNITH